MSILLCPECGELAYWNSHFKKFLCSYCEHTFIFNKVIIPSIIEYNHHGTDVKVQEHLKGRHREHCLCHQNCTYFKPESPENNCEIAQANFENCKKYGVVLPVWECPKYKELGKNKL